MTIDTITILHPGEMGAAIGARLRERGLRVLWIGQGRGQASRDRARSAGLEEAGSLAGALAASPLTLSVCPPHAAIDTARAVAACGYAGTYIDANAIAPATTLQVGEIVGAAGARFIDGGIVGPPPGPNDPRGRARLYLSGPEAPALAPALTSGALEVVALDGPIGQASALKAAFAAWNKGTLALLANVLALADAHGVDAALQAEWAQRDPEVIDRFGRVCASARKAWRWHGEMDQIAAAFEAAGLPGGAWAGAAEIYRRQAGFKDDPGAPALAAIVAALGARRSPSAR